MPGRNDVSCEEFEYQTGIWNPLTSMFDIVCAACPTECSDVRCEAGEYFVDEDTCVPCPEDCNECDYDPETEDYSCITCATGYLFNQGLCIPNEELCL